MKRMIHSLLAAAVLVSAMTCTAFAATEGITTDIEGVVDCVNPTTDVDEFTAKYSGVVSGEQYVLLVVKSDDGENYNAAKAENILYINQKAADSTTIAFDGEDKILPMAVENSLVLLGGTFTSGSSPKKLGTLIEQVPPYILGDVNADTRVNGLDTTKLMRSLARLETLTEIQSKAADVNQDTRVNGLDTTKLMRVLARLETMG